MITETSTEMLKLYGHYKNRILPFSGGIMEQPNYYVEAMETIERAVNSG